MTVTLENDNLLAGPVLHLGSLLTNGAMFQELMDADDANEALARVIYIESDEDESEQASLPRCIIGYSPHQFGTQRTSTTGWMTTGPVEARIEVATPAEYTTKQDEEIWWLNSVGKVIAQARAAAVAGGGVLNVINVTLGSYGRLDAEEFNRQRGMGVELVFEWRGS